MRYSHPVCADVTTLVLLITGATASVAVAQDLFSPIGEGPYSWDSYEEFAAEHDYSGQTLQITGASTGDDKIKLDNIFAYFAEATGADVLYSGSDSFEQDIVISLEAGSPPDIAMFPQPGPRQRPCPHRATSSRSARSSGSTSRRISRPVHPGPILRHSRGRTARSISTARSSARTSSRSCGTRPRPSTRRATKSPRRWRNSRRSPIRSSRTAGRRGASASAPGRRPAGPRPTGSRT